jgi:tetratricopeptide (TPR) repeat protein
MTFAVLAAVLVLWPVPFQAMAAEDSAHSPEPSFEKIVQAADRARTEERDKDAILLYQQGLKIRPEWEVGRWYLSTIFYGRERYLEARDLLRRFVAEDPPAGPAYALLGMSEFQVRDYSRALDHLKHAMSLGLGGRKDMAQSVFYYVSVLLTRFERYDESRNLLIAVVKSGQPVDTLVEPIGLAALRMPLLPSEIPSDRREMVETAGRAVLAIESGKRPEAEKLLSDLVAGHPSESGVHFLNGVFLLNEDPQRGISEIKCELEISPSHVPAKLRLADQYLKDQQIEDAFALAKEAVQLEPQDASAHMILGEALAAKGDSGGAIHALETARQQDPQTVRIRWDLVRAYTAAGRAADANAEKKEIQKLGALDSSR